MNRDDFPMLKNDYIYFNNASTTFKPEEVIEEMNNYYRNYGANTFRGVDSLGFKVTKKYDEARIKIANFIGANNSEIVFTRGTTESINIIARSFDILKPNDEVIISLLEHHSNFIPWQMICKEKNAILKILTPLEDGTISPSLLEENMSEKTKIVALNHVSNTMGGANNLKELSKVVHKFNAYFVVDGAQGLLNERINVVDLDIDFYVASAHKIFGPMGVGFLYGKYELLDIMKPNLYGGEMIDNVDMDSSTFKKPPYKFEAGTMMIPSVIGFGKAIDYINKIGLENIHSRTTYLRSYLIEKLNKIDSIEIYNKMNINSGIILFNIKGIHSHDIASLLDKYKIIVRAGHHCAQPFMKYLNITSSVRISLSFYNTIEECDKVVEVLNKAGDYLNELF